MGDVLGYISPGGATIRPESTTEGNNFDAVNVITPSMSDSEKNTTPTGPAKVVKKNNKEIDKLYAEVNYRGNVVIIFLVGRELC